MNKFFFASMLLVSSLAFAGQITVLDIPAKRVSHHDRLETKFLVDRHSGEASVEFAAVRLYYTHPGGYFPRTIMYETQKIEGLYLEGDLLIYHGEEDNVNCGKMGYTPVFKLPTLYLSGKCDLEARLEGRRIKVDFITR